MLALGGSLSGSSPQRMASAVTHNFIDDDFDWEAAVREVDHACQATDPPPPRPIDPLHQVPAANPLVHSGSGNSHRKSSASRQSTLDKFIGKTGNNYPSENQGQFEGGGAVSCIKIDPEVANTWIYPVNVPRRDYQLSITRMALFSNTLVALPTGLGKTLIAAVVMYNYFRWFPEGKIVFAAPSRPLVMQQIEACHNIVGIPQEWTIDMTGQTSPSRRACLWKAKRVFFVTPQVLEKDIQSGICLVEHLVCLVIDEAHRALGNYSYCVAVRELMAARVQLRILALTATPGSKQQTIQHIIDNLQISTLEYRSESDHDVRPYVHDRKIELLEVAMGQDAVEINKLLLEVIRPFVARLCAIGLLQNRDFQTLSPCDLLNSRDKFRQAPPLDLPTVKHGEVEGYFGVLITLYHIRKLLTSHGIRPAYEMLEEKLRQGSFARLMSRNEVLCKAKHLMQKSLSHGAPNPKLSKMLEVLIDHFKMKDPKNSRVIIFSNFRGSVRDIMDALANISELVKATQFVGQSSGKALKGQSQKVQQSVLEKFRSGGYNVIVATSIGEEGLDIMEVDLVICFDANISPLRMIQRMGRTGRKHDGRVVVLACEGSELKGYMRKQASSNTVKKHMRNGGMNSFNFHSSPRMIPHIFKPEVQFVELSIERFIPRGRKVKDDHPIETNIFMTQLTDAETDLLAKYFHPAKKCTWRPSLLAFPHFQAFPSRVQKVMHSFRTSMLIDAMQCLQGLSYTRGCKTLFAEDESLSTMGLGVEIVDQFEKGMKDVQHSHSSPEDHLHRKVTDSDPLLMETMATEKYYLPASCVQNNPMHSYLFGSNFVSVDSSGNVLVLSIPLLPLTDHLHSKCMSGSNAILLNCLEQDCSDSKASQGGYKEMSSRVKEMSNQTASLQTRCKEENKNMWTSGSCNSVTQQEDKLDGVETSLQTRVSKMSLSNEGESNIEARNENCIVELIADNANNELRDAELSPRLTNFINSGVVPESPIDCAGIPKGKSGGKLTVPILDSPAKSNTQVFLESPIPEKKDRPSMNTDACGRDVSTSVVVETQTPILIAKYSAVKEMVSAFPVIEEAQTPLVNPKNNSCSEDWCLGSGGKSATVQLEKKYKRLCKYGDHNKSRPPGTEGKICQKTKSASANPRPDPVYVKNDRGKRKPLNDVRGFIDEEAEVSSEVEVSDDEEEEQDNYSCDGSFIDDRINPTAANTQAENSRSDMMAIYRRSLLSQSPIKRLSYCSQEFSPDCVGPRSRSGESGSLGGTVNYYSRTHQTGFGRNSPFVQLEPERISSEAMPSTTNGNPIENESNICSRKRKLSFPQVRSVPAICLDQEFRKQQQGQQVEASGDAFDDDQFYEGLDLDAVEEQAAKLLGYNSEVSAPKRVMIPDPRTPQLDVLGSPSFDLGI